MEQEIFLAKNKNKGIIVYERIPNYISVAVNMTFFFLQHTGRGCNPIPLVIIVNLLTCLLYIHTHCLVYAE